MTQVCKTGQHDTDARRAAVLHGEGSMAGPLHRNVIACGFTDTVQPMISSSVAASRRFQDDSLTWVHIDARHDYETEERQPDRVGGDLVEEPGRLVRIAKWGPNSRQRKLRRNGG